MSSFLAAHQHKKARYEMNRQVMASVVYATNEVVIISQNGMLANAVYWRENFPEKNFKM